MSIERASLFYGLAIHLSIVDHKLKLDFGKTFQCVDGFLLPLSPSVGFSLFSEIDTPIRCDFFSRTATKKLSNKTLIKTAYTNLFFYYYRLLCVLLCYCWRYFFLALAYLFHAHSCYFVKNVVICDVILLFLFETCIFSCIFFSMAVDILAQVNSFALQCEIRKYIHVLLLEYSVKWRRTGKNRCQLRFKFKVFVVHTLYTSDAVVCLALKQEILT